MGAIYVYCSSHSAEVLFLMVKRGASHRWNTMPP